MKILSQLTVYTENSREMERWKQTHATTISFVLSLFVLS